MLYSFILFKITGWLSGLCTNDKIFDFLYIIAMANDSKSLLFLVNQILA